MFDIQEDIDNLYQEIGKRIDETVEEVKDFEDLKKVQQLIRDKN